MSNNKMIRLATELDETLDKVGKTQIDVDPSYFVNQKPVVTGIDEEKIKERAEKEIKKHKDDIVIPNDSPLQAKVVEDNNEPVESKLITGEEYKEKCASLTNMAKKVMASRMPDSEKSDFLDTISSAHNLISRIASDDSKKKH